jgi:hypothetical protein
LRAGALLGALLHPRHVAVAAFAQPLAELTAGVRRRIGAREATGDEAERRRLLADFLFDGHCHLAISP